MNSVISYSDSRFQFSGFWQENENGEIVSYKRVAMCELAFCGTYVKLHMRMDGEVRWVLDGEDTSPAVRNGEVVFYTDKAIHSLKAIIVSPNRAYIRSAETDGEFCEVAQKPYLHFIGDSITHAFPGYASAAGDALGGDYGVVAHCGMSLVDGWGWYDLIEGLHERVGMETNYFQLETPDVTADFTPYRFTHCRKPDAIVIYLGVNDYLTAGPLFKAENPKIFSDSYTRFIRKIRDIYADVPVIIVQCHLPDRDIRIQAIRDTFEKISSKLQDIHLADCNCWQIALSPDGIHPSADGYAQMADKMAALIAQLLKEKKS